MPREVSKDETKLLDLASGTAIRPKIYCWYKSTIFFQFWCCPVFETPISEVLWILDGKRHPWLHFDIMIVYESFYKCVHLPCPLPCSFISMTIEAQNSCSNLIYCVWYDFVLCWKATTWISKSNNCGRLRERENFSSRHVEKATWYRQHGDALSKKSNKIIRAIVS